MPKRQLKPIEAFLTDLSHAEYKVRREAMKGLRQSRNPASFPYLVAALKDTSISVIYHAIRGLEELGDPRAIPELLKMLGRNSSCDVCDEVGAALISFGAAAVPALIDTLQSSSERARAVATTCLTRIGDPTAVEPIIALLDDPHPWPLGAALAALWDFADERAREPLAAFLVRPDDSIPADEMTSAYDRKRSAAFALAELGDPRAIDVLARSFDQVQRACIYTIQQLGKIDDPRVRPLIQRYIDDDPESLCASQARATLEHLTARGL